VQLGLVASLNKPGGNSTGITILTSEVIPKRLQLLHDLVPSAKLFGFLANPDNVSVNSLALALTLNWRKTRCAIGGAEIPPTHASSVQGACLPCTYVALPRGEC